MIFDMSTIEIQAMDNGPYLVKGAVDLQDGAGNSYDVSDKNVIALCRCGASSNKPYCDGTHKSNGFTGDERAA
jgi:CDGSH-type Zn-finger protein